MREALAVDIGGTKTSVAVIDSSLKIINQIDFPTLKNPEAASEKARKAAKKLDPSGKLPVSLALCGLLSRKRDTLLIAPNLGWRDIFLKDLFSWINSGFVAVNDATAAAWASYIVGHENENSLLSVTLGTGVGGGIVIDGNLVLGAGELGHIKLDPEGARCGCGSRGCLETIAGGRYISDRAYDWEGIQVSSAEELTEEARKDSPGARRCFERMGYLTGYALAGVVNLNGIDRISIGGGIANAAGKFFMDSLKDSLINNLMVPDKQQPVIRLSRFRRNMSLIGAGAIVLKPPKNLKDSQ